MTIHGAVGVDDFPTVGALAQEPFGIAVKHLVIPNVRQRILRLPGRQGTVLDRFRIEHGRRHQQQLGAAGQHFLAQRADAGLEFLEALLAKRIINAVVHAVAGDDQFGSRFLEGAVQPFQQTGTGKLPARMARLA